MNRSIIVVGLTLLAVCPACAAPTTPVPAASSSSHSPAATAVQQYLNARDAGQAEKAHALLSAATRKLFPLAKYRTMPIPTGDKAGEGMTPLLISLAALFSDAPNATGYRFSVVGVQPGTSDTLLVRALPPGTGAGLILKVVTAPDPAGGPPRLELLQSMQQTDGRGLTDVKQEAISQFNLEQIGLGLIQYNQDHDETYPPAATWSDAVKHYIKNPALFHDPVAPAGQAWSYAYNRNFSRAELALVMTPATTVVVFESTTGTKNASDTGQSVPRPGRHHGGTDYLFADGHVKWLPDRAKVSYQLSGK